MLRGVGWYLVTDVSGQLRFRVQDSSNPIRMPGQAGWLRWDNNNKKKYILREDLSAVLDVFRA
jgi:hypothetical protein